MFTFVGDPVSVVEAAFQFSKTAYELIDMSKHSGEHPRMGAVDVVPFVPVANVTTEECVECSKKYGKRVGEELGVPVYLYEEASSNPERKMLRQIRSGEYEGIKIKFTNLNGNLISVLRNLLKVRSDCYRFEIFLVAYNVNILGTKEQAHKIALNVREQGRSEDSPGRLKAVKGIGWYVNEYNMAQVSMNLDNYKITRLTLHLKNAQ